MTKNTPSFTWFSWGAGAERWSADTRAKTAAILRGARARRQCERVDRGLYRVTLRGYDVMALIRTR
jgi:hypothetical protein